MDTEIGRNRYVIKYGMPLSRAKLAEETKAALSKTNNKLVEEEWHLINEAQARNTLDGHQLADRVIVDSERIRDMTSQLSRKMRLNSERRCEERIANLDHVIEELEVHRKELCLELEMLDGCKTRGIDFRPSLQNALKICGKCVVLRQGRVGVDLVYDDVDKALEHEIKVIVGGQDLISDALRKLDEQMRRLRAVRFAIDKDTSRKQKALQVENATILMDKPYDLEYHDNQQLLTYKAVPTYEDWQVYTLKLTNDVMQELTSSRKLQQLVQQLLIQIFNDVKDAYQNTNMKFIARIKSLKHAKERLNGYHSETIKRAQDMKQNIILLEKDLKREVEHLELVRSRSLQRTFRPHEERIEDSVTKALDEEEIASCENIEELKEKIIESEHNLIHLNKLQVEIEEDINLKNNSIKIDEVECLQIRENISINQF